LVPVFHCVKRPMPFSLAPQFALAALASAILLFVLKRSGISAAILDQPDRANAMHLAPTPRVGGVAMFIATTAMIILCVASNTLEVPLAISVALVIISVVDDKLQLPALPRLTAHVGAAIAVTWFATAGALSPNDALTTNTTNAVVLVLIALAITWSTNLYNFMDGADGLAGGMAMFGFGAYAMAASHAPDGANHAATMASISAIISGAALGFLVFNFPPAKVFMGDAGSIPLGFLAAALGLYGVLWKLWDWWFPLLVFSPFIVDATVTLIKRAFKLKKVWEAHREHYYHRLILGGWSHRRNALAYFALMIVCGASALYARTLEKPAPILAFWVVTYALLLFYLERRFKGQNKNQ
jgi:UDP-GlcNAc:undecaprenyl-phosphate/decaprenyl-phosphate GlcNAc-1-phosphate transferase